jgi:hypothetical protein
MFLFRPTELGPVRDLAWKVFTYFHCIINSLSFHHPELYNLKCLLSPSLIMLVPRICHFFTNLWLSEFLSVPGDDGVAGNSHFLADFEGAVVKLLTVKYLCEEFVTVILIYKQC